MVSVARPFTRAAEATRIAVSCFFFPSTASQKSLLEHLEQNTLPKPQFLRHRPGWLTILLLGGLSLITPFSVDMYLPPSRV
jgi:hypothetical protein